MPHIREAVTKYQLIIATAIVVLLLPEIPNYSGTCTNAYLIPTRSVFQSWTGLFLLFNRMETT